MQTPGGATEHFSGETFTSSDGKVLDNFWSNSPWVSPPPPFPRSKVWLWSALRSGLDPSLSPKHFCRPPSSLNIPGPDRTHCNVPQGLPEGGFDLVFPEAKTEGKAAVKRKHSGPAQDLPSKRSSAIRSDSASKRWELKI